ncbi:MAG TPA: hypothetical protein VHL98_02310 [Microvirga sp.]|jgi:hypothetical protein|nr:hypothetical protein [Microvirga sp.]
MRPTNWQPDHSVDTEEMIGELVRRKEVAADQRDELERQYSSRQKEREAIQGDPEALESLLRDLDALQAEMDLTERQLKTVGADLARLCSAHARNRRAQAGIQIKHDLHEMLCGPIMDLYVADLIQSRGVAGQFDTVPQARNEIHLGRNLVAQIVAAIPSSLLHPSWINGFLEMTANEFADEVIDRSSSRE